MLTVRRSRGYAAWFGWYSRRQFRKHFHSVRVSVPPETLAMNTGYPVVFYCNHAYWWDGFWSQLCTEEFFRQNLFIIIEYQQLVKHRFFTRLGAFSLDRSKPRTVIETVEYASRCLSSESRNQNALWIFPQGKIENVDVSPMRFFNGTAAIVAKTLGRTSGIYLVSVVSRIEYLEEQRPELFLSFGKPEYFSATDAVDKSGLTRRMERETARRLASLKEKIVNGEISDFRTIVKGRESVNRRVEKFRGRVGLR
ncbi:glycerol acyltransferase [Prosthecochloris sp. GSB1]|uniref:lysophospholipid acyltransferase family protein n=1 Tax=Prosthecochloris sp. GSB1 TaxID=281093 RepID=UPI000B8C703A|nr:lysophospholipid acyltransferase family protein [Prosthecochloris sp. GSB1]ASQ90302.1 glycerol acyltransferase [Prosthecochloris sp. GSB1]